MYICSKYLCLIFLVHYIKLLRWFYWLDSDAYTCMLCLFASGIQNVWFMERPWQAHLVGLTQLWHWGEKRFFKIVSWYDNECLASKLFCCGTHPRCFLSWWHCQFDVIVWLTPCWGGATATGLSTCWCTWLRPKIFHRPVLEHGIEEWHALAGENHHLKTTVFAPPHNILRATGPQSKRVPAAV